MSSEEARERLRQMREKAKDLADAAERSSDPQQRDRLQKESRSLESRCEQESGMRSGDIYPWE
ncbi:DUF6381 family protein [Streptomyces sp. SID5910]|uniref:DUF6381 family protein n=1 Tax=Streptomyces sp. SID5910 TaxID=2690312 RepID=UPI001367DF59|nr:DUF6381 family protein [Streptomyces sp. SID5910]MYR41937.1 small hydrophilic protein [Streptomyces sp. SID5910]MYR44000.1 small hydrophilic protein [Streptomyces sp. SID5910]